VFGIDILENGRITDFQAIRKMHEEFQSHYFYQWKDLKEKYLPIKKELEEKLKAE